MKLFTFLMIVATMNLSAGVYSQDSKISLKHRQTTLAGIIEAIETQSEFRIFYKTDQIDTRSEIRLDQKEGSIASVLAYALEGSDITYKVLDKLIVLTPSADANQPVSVTGIITDSETGLPLPGVNILVDGTNKGAISDAEGKYTIEAPNANAILVFSFIGYTQKRVEMNGRTKIDVSMAPDVKSLDEVVVIGYGTRSKRDVTTSISSVDAAQLEKSVSMSPDLAMQGRMTGVLVTGNSGNPMDRPTVRIRGVNTWGVSSPLYVIDGIPITELGSGIEGQENARVADVRGPINIMTLIDPNDIESISVLKDASAAAIY
ncbi:MAG TPA: carboxypeptidase-like regulatory domain-containing protein, partial [Bacteroidales bacterium]|nr:carboxypeptidase-like regulatory domain-containing protein [Bacteroidales bacterium]